MRNKPFVSIHRGFLLHVDRFRCCATPHFSRPSPSPSHIHDVLLRNSRNSLSPYERTLWQTLSARRVPARLGGDGRTQEIFLFRVYVPINIFNLIWYEREGRNGTWLICAYISNFLFGIDEFFYKLLTMVAFSINGICLTNVHLLK